MVGWVFLVCVKSDSIALIGKDDFYTNPASEGNGYQLTFVTGIHSSMCLDTYYVIHRKLSDRIMPLFASPLFL